METPSQAEHGDAAASDRQPMVGPGYGSPIPPLDATSAGEPLPAHVASDFGSRLGADLGGVRVHTGDESGRLTDSMDARAFTTGQDIHFAAGQYDPGSRDGERLLAHEIAHTVQGSATPAAPATKQRASAPAEPHELEADTAAAALVDGTGPVQISRAAPAEAIHRKPKDTDQAASPYTPADQVEQVRLALRAATAAARTAIASASKARGEAESQAALDRGAQSIDHHLRFARSQMDAIDPTEVASEAASLAVALADFRSQASGLETPSIQSVRAQSLTVDAWAQTSGAAPSAPAGRFGTTDAARGVGLSLRAVRHFADQATATIAPQADGDTRPAAIARAATSAALILPHLSSAKTLLADHFTDPASHAALTDDVATASRALGELIAWTIYMRAEPSHLALVESAMNDVRRAVSLPDTGWLGERPKDQPRPAVEWGDPITTGDFEDAKDLVLDSYRALQETRAAGVNDLSSTIPKVDAQELGWSAEIASFFADVALHAVTGFLGGAIAHGLAAAGATAASRGLNTAMNDAVKGGLRQLVSETVKSRFKSEGDAAQAFCLGQKEALSDVARKQRTRFLNGLEPIREIERRQKGAGIAELEMLRHSIDEVSGTLAKQAQFDASLAEWVKLLARASTGDVDHEHHVLGSNPEAIADFNEVHRGVLYLSMTADLNDPAAPLSFHGATIRGINKQLIGDLSRINRSIGELELPVHVRTAQFALGMNECGNVWLTVISGLMGLFSWDTTPSYRYLYRRAHGGEEADEERMKAGAIDGARKILLEEIAPMRLSDLNVQDSGRIR